MGHLPCQTAQLAAEKETFPSYHAPYRWMQRGDVQENLRHCAARALTMPSRALYMQPAEQSAATEA